MLLKSSGNLKDFAKGFRQIPVGFGKVLYKTTSSQFFRGIFIR